MSPSHRSRAVSIPDWQDQAVLPQITRTLNRQPSHSSTTSDPDSPTNNHNSSAKRNSMFGSIKKHISRKGSNASRTSDRSVSPQPPLSPQPQVIVQAPTFRGPVELSAAVERINLSAASPADNPLRNPSPPTRRPDRPGMNAFTTPSTEPPPAYSASPSAASGPTLGPSPEYTPPTPTARSPSPAPSQRSITSLSGSGQPEDPYAFLTTFDTLLLIDDSGSMAGRSWRETSSALKALLPIICAHDHDGIDIYFLNHFSSSAGNIRDGIAAGGHLNVTSAAEVERIFRTVRPSGGTPTGTRLRAILKPYLARLESEHARGQGKMDEVKPLNILAITDGVPSDDVESVLIAAARKLDALEAAPHQVGVQFFQVGNEEGAAEALRELDDELGDLAMRNGGGGGLGGGIRDMVDTCTWMGGVAREAEDGAPPELKLTAEGILKVVLGAVVKRLDRRRASVEIRR